jgi:hypothetical protein
MSAIVTWARARGDRRHPTTPRRSDDAGAHRVGPVRRRRIHDRMLLRHGAEGPNPVPPSVPTGETKQTVPDSSSEEKTE